MWLGRVENQGAVHLDVLEYRKVAGAREILSVQHYRTAAWGISEKLAARRESQSEAYLRICVPY